MIKKHKIFGREFEWYDIKTKFKKLLRGIFYLKFTQKLICYLIVLYLYLVYFTSKKKFKIPTNIIEKLDKKQPIIVAFWHNRLSLAAFYALYFKKNVFNNTQFVSLSSKHGDGKFVGEVMEIFGFENIAGSSQNNRKSSRGIDTSSLRKLIRLLKSGSFLGITPDGPRGPNQKVNSEIINIAKISKASILPVSCASSRYKEFNSWDKFKLPLPFSKINFHCEDFIEIDQEDEEHKLKLILEQSLNNAQTNSIKGIEKI